MVQAVRDLGLAGVRHHGLFDDDMNVVTGLAGPVEETRSTSTSDGEQGPAAVAPSHEKPPRTSMPAASLPASLSAPPPASPRFVYNFTKISESWDFQVAHNVTPVVELSFMPAFLAGCT